MYPYKRRLSISSSIVLKPFSKKVSSATEKISAELFSPVRLYMNGLITPDEYKNISKYDIVKLRIYHKSNRPLLAKVILRMGMKKIHHTFRKYLYGY